MDAKVGFRLLLQPAKRHVLVLVCFAVFFPAWITHLCDYEIVLCTSFFPSQMIGLDVGLSLFLTAVMGYCFLHPIKVIKYHGDGVALPSTLTMAGLKFSAHISAVEKNDHFQNFVVHIVIVGG